jgi:hypothetical protein
MIVPRLVPLTNLGELVMKRAKGERFSLRTLQRMQNAEACTLLGICLSVLGIGLKSYVFERKEGLRHKAEGLQRDR